MGTFRLNDETTVDPVSKQDPNETKVINPDASGVQHQVDEKPEGVREIILKGPLSHAYTEALNILLDKNENKTQDLRQESVHLALHAAQIVEDEEEEAAGPVPDSAKAFVYVYDGKKMGLSDVSEMYEELSQIKETRPEAGFVGGVIENAETMLSDPSAARNLETMTVSFEHMKIPLYFSRTACMNSLTNFLVKR